MGRWMGFYFCEGVSKCLMDALERWSKYNADKAYSTSGVAALLNNGLQDHLCERN